MRLNKIALISVALAMLTLTVPLAFATCPTENCPGKVTGGGWFLCDCFGHKMTFGFNVVLYPGEAVKGELEVQDHTWGWNIHAHDIDTLCVDGNSATFEGPCTINHIEGFRFKVHVVDNGEPGCAAAGGTDVFEIWLYGAGDPLLNLPYHAVGNPIDGGNIQIHWSLPA